MSAFLGPIHYWLYHKIQLQQELVHQLINLGEETYALNLKEVCEAQYGKEETKPLEDVIDSTNIHGWLQNQVSQVEYKLAYCVKELINKDQNVVEKLESIFEEVGRIRRSDLESPLNAMKLYKVINDTLLDGMPCDHASTILEQSEQCVIWKRNLCVHKNYWDEVGADIAIYYRLRGAWLIGFVNQEGYCLEIIDEVTYAIRKGE